MKQTESIKWQMFLKIDAMVSLSQIIDDTNDDLAESKLLKVTNVDVLCTTTVIV